jgi:hypothetical protein
MNNLEANSTQEQDDAPTIRLKCFAEVEQNDAEQIETSHSVPLKNGESFSEQLEELLLSLHDPGVTPESVIRRSVESNQRQFARCAIQEQRAGGILTVNRRSYDCRLVEMSIGGFGIIVPGIPKLPIGVDGQLRAPGMNYIVRITRQELRPGCTFVGLRKIEEIVDPEPQLDTSPSIFGYLIAGAAGALIATLMYYYRVGG